MIKCAKMQSNGNDFLILDNMSLAYKSDFLPNFAQKACRRRTAVGADGLVVIEPSEIADFKMRIFNPDSTEGEMCGNGARCAARYAIERKIAGSCDFIFETLSGLVRAAVFGEDVTLEIAPIMSNEIITDGHITVNSCEYAYFFVPVGVPHCVIFEKEHALGHDGYIAAGRAIRNRLDVFPNGTHVNFAVIEDEQDTINVLTYERGVEDMTLSCGTGSVASSVAAWLSGRVGRNISVRTPGGTNRVFLSNGRKGEIFSRLEGKAVFVAELMVSPEILR